MSVAMRVLIFVFLLGLVAGVLVMRDRNQEDMNPADNSVVDQDLPRLIDLGADKCIPCKEMAPILEELSHEYAGQFVVQFIDVWKFPDLAKPYDLRLIPTQIFLDADGKELMRHEGFFSKEDILQTWADHGVKLTAPTPHAADQS